MKRPAEQDLPVGRSQKIPKTKLITQDQSLFESMGSMLNIPTRDWITGGFFNNCKLSHYSQSQQIFAALALKSLINLKEIRSEDIFNRDQPITKVSREEICRIESVYEKITNDRLNIAITTKPTKIKKSTAQQALAIVQDQKTKYETSEIDHNEKGVELLEINSELDSSIDEISRLIYCHSSKQLPTLTKISQIDRYKKYCGRLPTKELRLGYLIDILGINKKSGDDDIILGSITQSDGRTKHHMGSYRAKPTLDDSDDDNETSQNESIKTKIEEADRKIERVDEVTAIAAKIALLNTDEDEALRAAFIFGILRGYNLRNVIGACFAHEMSIRWIFLQRGWEQFCKTEGTYLDIEASILCDQFSPDKDRDPKMVLEEIIKTQVEEYKKSISTNHLEEKDCSQNRFFCEPFSVLENDFEFYLIATGDYKNQSEEIIKNIATSQFHDPYLKTAFHVAASIGDEDFFEIITKMEKDELLKQEISSLFTEDELDEVLTIAENYDKYFGEKVEDFMIKFSLKPSKLTRPKSSEKLEEVGKIDQRNNNSCSNYMN